ncbi:MAG TPA: zinc ABC transporter substrate-binding protein [Burkholderiales bacterium]|nr:zinc ABC transporter substrate-binding protein [Burkholderiales bacterium]
MIKLVRYSIAAAVVLATGLFGRPAAAALDVFACEPEWGALVKELAGDKARLYVATTARQDPHRIEARPSLIARARSAELVVCTGADLEVGWLPLVQQQSANPAIQTGRPGYFEAARQIQLAEVPQRLDRSQGDVHAAGNPHVHLDPRNIAKVAAALAERMAELDPKEAAHYRGRAKNFLGRWAEASARWEKQGAALKGMPVVVYHRDLTYLVSWLGMREAGSLEPKPGLPPTTGHLSELLARLAREPAKAIVRAAYNDPRPGEWLSERSKIPLVVLPYTVGGTEKATDLFGLFDDTIARLTAVAK